MFFNFVTLNSLFGWEAERNAFALCPYIGYIIEKCITDFEEMIIFILILMTDTIIYKFGMAMLESLCTVNYKSCNDRYSKTILIRLRGDTETCLGTNNVYIILISTDQTKAHDLNI